MPDDKVIDGVVALSPEELAELNKGDIGTVDDATIQALADKSGDTVEHIKEMLKLHEPGGADAATAKAAADKAAAEAAAATGDDKLLAGKYKTEGDLDQGIQSLIDKYGKEKAYKMLESSMGAGDDAAAKAAAAKAAADKVAADALAAGDALTGDDAAAKAAAKAAEGGELDMDKYAEEYAENQTLSEASYAELDKAGLDKELVNSYISAISAQAELYTGKVYEKAGGQEKYDALVAWGSENLNSAERVRFNDAMNSQDLAQAGLVLDALSARMEKVEGTFKRASVDIKDNIDGAGSVIGYASHQEMQADMRDPRYRNGDKAFHALVKAKLAASTNI